MSFSTTVLIGRADGANAHAEQLTLSADAGWFDDEVIGEACSLMSRLAPVEGRQLLQFSAVDDAKIVLEMGLNFVVSLGPGLATSAVWDGIKYLLARRKDRDGGVVTATRIEIVTDLNAGKVTGIIDTSNAAVAGQALAAYSAAVEVAAKVAGQPKQVIVWKRPDDRWVPPS